MISFITTYPSGRSVLVSGIKLFCCGVPLWREPIIAAMGGPGKIRCEIPAKLSGDFPAAKCGQYAQCPHPSDWIALQEGQPKCLSLRSDNFLSQSVSVSGCE